MSIVVDYKSTTLRTNPSIGIARKVLHILQAHYPETLGRGLVVNLPTILAFFYRGIAPFMDPITRDKVSSRSCRRVFACTKERTPSRPSFPLSLVFPSSC